jgi:hypothetical protein
MQPTLISVIIPTYNRAHLLADAILSALAQDYPHKQIIVVDDGSTDATRQLVESFAGVEYVYQENKGQAAARNTGLQHSRGEYVASLDSDDIWNPEFLRLGIAQLQSGYGLVFMNWRSSSGHNGLESFFGQSAARQRYLTNPIGQWWHLSAAQTRRLMLETCPAPSSSFIIRRSAIHAGWNEQMLIADDWGLLLDIVLRQPTTTAFTLEPYWLKRIHGQNIYDGRDHVAVARELTAHDEPLLLSRYRAQLTQAEIGIFRQRQVLSCISCAYHCYKQKARVDTFRHLGRAFRLAPLSATWLVSRELGRYLRMIVLATR